MKKILVVVVIALIAIQFIRPTRNINTNPAINTKDISTKYNVPDSVKKILETSCYDCHSNNTVYPAYANIQPVGWWLNNHIEEGKEELNFNEFASYSIRRQYNKFGKIASEVKEDDMPLSSYTFIHKYAILSADQKNQLINWAVSLKDSIKANYPADSLKKR